MVVKTKEKAIEEIRRILYWEVTVADRDRIFAELLSELRTTIIKEEKPNEAKKLLESLASQLLPKTKGEC